jgi:hypothetical protein
MNKSEKMKAKGAFSLKKLFLSVLELFKDKKSASRILLFFASLAFAVVSLSQVIYYITGPAEGYFHSDCADTLYWAEAAFDAGAVFNPNFDYAGLLPFSAQIWLVPLISLFGVTMKTHVIGMVIFALLFFAALIFFCRSMEWSYSFSFFVSGSAMLMLSGSEKLREIMWEHVIYYSLGLLILLTGMGLMLRMCKNFEQGKTKRAWIYAAIFFIFMTLGATNGLQCLAIYTLPMFAAIAAEMTFNSKEKIFSKHNKYYIFAAILLASSAVFGLLLLSAWKGDIVAAYANGFSLLDGVSSWMDNLRKFPSEYFLLFGVNIIDGAVIGEIDTIFKLVRFATALVLIILPLILLLNYKKIEEKGIKLVLWVHIAVSAVIMFGFVCGRLSAGNWRLIPMLGTAIIASFSAIRFMLASKDFSLSFRRVGAICLVFPLLCSLVNYKEIGDMPSDYGRDNETHVLAQFLVDNGLEYGYAEFWTASATTIVSDSKVKVRSVNIARNEGVTAYLYQSNIYWFYDQEGIDEYFIVLSDEEYSRVSNTAQWATLSEHLTKKLICGNFRIFVFDINPMTTPTK